MLRYMFCGSHISKGCVCFEINKQTNKHSVQERGPLNPPLVSVYFTVLHRLKHFFYSSEPVLIPEMSQAGRKPLKTMEPSEMR